MQTVKTMLWGPTPEEQVLVPYRHRGTRSRSIETKVQYPGQAEHTQAGPRHKPAEATRGQDEDLYPTGG